MRVLQQSIYFPPEVGGLESHVYHLCRELARMEEQVTVVTSRSRPDSPRRETMDGVRVVRCWFPARNPAGWIAHTAVTVPTYLTLARGADVLHAQTFASAPPAMLARRLYGSPYVLTLHTSHFLALANRPRWRPVLRRLVAAADRVLAASEEIRDVALGLAPNARAEALTNGVDTATFRPVPAAIPPEDGRRRIIVPRRLYPKNGVEHLVRALPLVARSVDVEALIVGDGPERERLVALARELGVDDRTRFLGLRPNEAMPALFASAEVAVFPSLMEATSVAALEAMSCGLPVAASRVGGLPEIVDESTGTLFRPADPRDLADKLVGLLERPGLGEIGERARARVVERWSVARLADRHREIYRRLIEERSG